MRRAASSGAGGRLWRQPASYGTSDWAWEGSFLYVFYKANTEGPLASLLRRCRLRRCNRFKRHELCRRDEPSAHPIQGAYFHYLRSMRHKILSLCCKGRAPQMHCSICSHSIAKEVFDKLNGLCFQCLSFNRKCSFPKPVSLEGIERELLPFRMMLQVENLITLIDLFLCYN